MTPADHIRQRLEDARRYLGETRRRDNGNIAAAAAIGEAETDVGLWLGRLATVTENI